MVNVLTLLSIERLKMLHCSFVLALVLIEWFGEFLVSFDLSNPDMLANFDEKIRVEEAALGVFTLSPRIFNRVKVPVGRFDPSVNYGCIFWSDQPTNKFAFRFVVSDDHVERCLEMVSVFYLLPCRAWWHCA